jgi:hypothetical protein
MGADQNTGLIFGYIGRDDLKEALYHCAVDALEEYHVEQSVTEFTDTYMLYNSSIWTSGDADDFNSIVIDCSVFSLEAQQHETSRFEDFFEAIGVENAGPPKWYLVSYEGD